jgi:hypothetical protein
MKTKAAHAALSAALLIAILLAGCGKQTTENTPLFATLSELKGKVGIQGAGESQFTDAKPDAVVHRDGQIQTGDDGRVRLDLSTGTIIRISPSTLFKLTANEETEEGLATRLQLEVGRVFIILSGGSMDVDTPSGVASVRGSYMMVEVDPTTGDVLVTCLEGECGASNGAGGVQFTNGQRAVLFHRDPATGQYQVPGVGPMTPEDFQKWLDENPEARDLYNQAMATLTALAPTQEPTEEPTAEPTEAPVLVTVGPPADGSTCIELVYPPVDSNQPYNGAVTFAWDSHVEAAKYIVTINYPNGVAVQFETTETDLTRYFESMPAGGSYSWTVTAIGANGNSICSSDSAGFSKPAPEPTKKREKKPEPTCDPCDLYGGCFTEDPSCYLTQAPPAY